MQCVLPVSKRVFDFYSANPHLNFEAMSTLMLDFIEQMGNDMTKILHATITGEILHNIRDLKHQVAAMNDTFINRLHEHSKEFFETNKLIVSLNANENVEKISQLLNRSTDSFFEKINNALPRNQDELTKKVQDNLLSFQNQIKTEMQQALHSAAPNEYMASLEGKLAHMQQPIFAALAASQQQISKQVNTINEEANKNQTDHNKVMGELRDFLSKYKSTTYHKGTFSENALSSLLTDLYPDAEIVNTSTLTASGDFIVRRQNKPVILVENKNYNTNVEITQVHKFIRDVNEQKCSGIMLSQTSGIAGKPNGFIEVNKSHVLIYLHKVEYSAERVKMAFDIIDNMTQRLKNIEQAAANPDNCISIDQHMLETINTQFQNFLTLKDGLIQNAENSYKNTVRLLKELKMPDLAAFLKEHFAEEKKDEFKCDVCNLSFETVRSLASHSKAHKGTSSGGGNSNGNGNVNSSNNMDEENVVIINPTNFTVNTGAGTLKPFLATNNVKKLKIGK